MPKILLGINLKVLESQDLSLSSSGMNFQFKVPETIPQDILLIRDIVGDIPPLKPDLQKDVRDSIDSSDDSIASSSSEIDSEDEVEAGLLVPDEEPSTRVPVM